MNNNRYSFFSRSHAIATNGHPMLDTTHVQRIDWLESEILGSVAAGTAEWMVVG